MMSAPASSQRRIWSIVALRVLGRRVGHGLDADRRVAADRHGADHDLPRLAPLDIAPGTDGHGRAYRRLRPAGKAAPETAIADSYLVVLTGLTGLARGRRDGQACPIAGQ